eukprot:297759-Rhodomonas_salina.1
MRNSRPRCPTIVEVYVQSRRSRLKYNQEVSTGSPISEVEYEQTLLPWVEAAACSMDRNEKQPAPMPEVEYTDGKFDG